MTITFINLGLYGCGRPSVDRNLHHRILHPERVCWKAAAVVPQGFPLLSSPS